MALIGYGEADFHSMVTKGHHFVDRTSFIARQESLGSRNLLFVRPRRFGKSLWISVLQHYYDARFKDEFDFLFGKYYMVKTRLPIGIIMSFYGFNFRVLMSRRMKKRM
jgi:hypothetical protein